MKKQNQSRRPQNPGNFQRNNNGNGRPARSHSNGQGQFRSGSSNGQHRSHNPNGQYRSGHNKSNAEAVKQWMEPSSGTFTSHILAQTGPGFSRKQTSNGNGNGNGNQGYKSKPKNRNQFDKNKSHSSNGNGFQKPRSGQRPKRDFQDRKKEPQNRNNNASLGKPQKEMIANIDAFQLFCAYHLGIGPKKEYKPSNIHEVARRFSVNPATIKEALKEYSMDPASLLELDFDMALAQLDIQVAPEGIDRTELAKTIYEDFQAAPHIKRDWDKILEEDRKENMKVFGKG